MPQMTGKFGLAVMIAAFALFGCSDPTAPGAIFNAETGKHPDGWTASHGSSYVTYKSVCHDCHGSRLDGGPSQEGCFTNTACHAGVISCGTCHALPPNGALFPNAAGAHAVHRALNFGFVCDDCHAGAGTGTALHMNYIAETVFSAVVQTTFSAKTGALGFDAASGTCSKASCHGGITTPNWTTGAIDVNSQCGSCHTFGTASQTPEYNSFYSGEHSRHVNGEGIGCTSCHDTTALAAVHFDDLTTTAMIQAPASLGNQIITYTGGSCTPRCHGNETW